MHYFSRKIFCLNCKKKFKYKKERSIPKYIDSTYDITGQCSRIVIEENFLLNLIERRFGRKFTIDEVQSIVDKIDVKSKYEFVIYFHNDKPIVSMDGHFQF